MLLKLLTMMGMGREMQRTPQIAQTWGERSQGGVPFLGGAKQLDYWLYILKWLKWHITRRFFSLDYELQYAGLLTAPISFPNQVTG